MSRARWPDGSASTGWEEKVKEPETKHQLDIRREDPWSQGNGAF